MAFIPFKKESKRGDALRQVAEKAGVFGASPVDAFEFMSKAPTNLRADALNASSGVDQAKIRLNETEVAQQLADRLKHAGPATFRDLREAFGVDAIDAVQKEVGLTPATNVKNAGKNISTTGNTPDTTFQGVRKSLENSLIPESPQASARRTLVGKRKKKELADAVEAQLDEQIVDSNRASQPANIFEQIGNTIQGVGGSFLDKLFAQPETTPTQPVSNMLNIPETGESIDFEQDNFVGNVDPNLRKLEDEALLAISNGADPAKVKARLAQMITQLKGGNQ